MRALFIGGTGTISAACVRAAIDAGHDVSVLNRGSGRRPLPPEVHEIVADIRDEDATRAALDGASFDVVADFLSFTPAHVETALRLVEGLCGQYIFISSASAYGKPPRRLPVTESTPLRNPFWKYSRDKIACEDVLVGAYRDRGLPVTIVRPSHTYDHALLPTSGGWTDIARMREGKPVVVHGDGTSLWTLTHSDDFAVAFTGLLGAPEAIGEAAGVTEPRLVHVASETIAAFVPDLGPGLVGDKAHSMVFDNAKIRALVPEFRTTVLFDEGARRILAHYDANPELQRVDPELDAAFDRMVAHAEAAGS